MIIEEIDKEPSDAISEDDHTFQEISTKNSDSLSTINASFTQFNLDDLIQNNGVGNECYIDNSDILHRFDTENECDEDEENNKSDRCFTESFGNEPIEEIIENNKIEEITNVPNNSNNNSIMKIVAKAIHDKFDNVDPSNFFMRAPEKRIMINEPRKTFSNQVCQTESDKTIDGHDKFSEIDPVCIISPFEFHNDMNDNGHSGLHEITNENFSTEICNRPQLQPTLLECELEQKVQHQPRIDHKFIERNNLNKNKLHKDKFQLQDTFRKKRRPQRQFQKMKMPPNKLQQSSFNGNNFNKLVEHMPQHSSSDEEDLKEECEIVMKERQLKSKKVNKERDNKTQISSKKNVENEKKMKENDRLTNEEQGFKSNNSLTQITIDDMQMIKIKVKCPSCLYRGFILIDTKKYLNNDDNGKQKEREKEKEKEKEKEGSEGTKQDNEKVRQEDALQETIYKVSSNHEKSFDNSKSTKEIIKEMKLIEKRLKLLQVQLMDEKDE